MPLISQLFDIKRTIFTGAGTGWWIFAMGRLRGRRSLVRHRARSACSEKTRAARAKWVRPLGATMVRTPPKSDLILQLFDTETCRRRRYRRYVGRSRVPRRIPVQRQEHDLRMYRKSRVVFTPTQLQLQPARLPQYCEECDRHRARWQWCGGRQAHTACVRHCGQAGAGDRRALDFDGYRYAQSILRSVLMFS